MIQNMKSKISRIVIEIAMIVFAFMWIYPIIMVLFISLKSDAEAVRAPFTIPQQLNFVNYVKAYNGMHYLRSFLNSFLITFFSASIGVLLYSMTAYAIVRVRKGKIVLQGMFYLFLLSLAMPTQMALIPLSLLLKMIHINNTQIGLILVFIAARAGLGVFIIHSFINTIPIAIEEAAIIDGCTPFKIFFKIALPLLKPPVVTLLIYISIYVWNDFLYPLILLQGEHARTLPLAVYYFRGSFFIKWNLLFAGLILSILPVLIFYFLMQDKITSGLTKGAVKG